MQKISRKFLLLALFFWVQKFEIGQTGSHINILKIKSRNKIVEIVKKNLKTTIVACF